MTLSLEQVVPLVGSCFTVQTSGGPVELRLASATERPRKGLPEEFRTPLSLIFDGPPHMRLAQDNYVIAHPAIGELVLAIVPVSPAPQYEILLM